MDLSFSGPQAATGNDADEDWQELPSGVRFQVLHKGQGEAAQDGDVRWTLTEGSVVVLIK